MKLQKHLLVNSHPGPSQPRNVQIYNFFNCVLTTMISLPLYISLATLFTGFYPILTKILEDGRLIALLVPIVD